VLQIKCIIVELCKRIEYDTLLTSLVLGIHDCFSSYPILSCQDLMPVMFLDLYGNLYVQVRKIKQKKFFLKNLAHCMLILF